MGFILAYLYLTLTDSKGKGQVKVMHVSTETGHYWSERRKIFVKIIKETGFNCECYIDNCIPIKKCRSLILELQSSLVEYDVLW